MILYRRETFKTSRRRTCLYNIIFILSIFITHLRVGIVQWARKNSEDNP